MAVGTSTTAVVTVTYNAEAFIDKTLDSIEAMGLSHVVIVDNGSHDRTADLVESRDLGTLHRGTNIGFGAGCNLGFSMLPEGVDYVLFLNPDAELPAADLGRLVDYLDAHPEVGVVGPRIFSGEVELPNSGSLPTVMSALHPTLPRPGRAITPTHVTKPGVAVTGKVGFVEGACFLVRREPFVASGRFDERYFLFFEEPDLSQRMLRLGYETHHVAEARAQHLRSESRKAVPDQGKGILWASTWTYLRIWKGAMRADSWAVLARMAWSLRVLTGLLDRDIAQHWRTTLTAARRSYAPRSIAQEGAL